MALIQGKDGKWRDPGFSIPGPDVYQLWAEFVCLFLEKANVTAGFDLDGKHTTIKHASTTGTVIYLDI